MAGHSVPQAPGTAIPRQLQRRWQREFQQRWQTGAPRQWCCIGIDVGKYEQVAMAYDGAGQFLGGPLRFGIRVCDYQRLFAWAATLLPDPDWAPLFGAEPTGHYYEQLVYELSQKYGSDQVYIVQATDVARRREDWNQGTFKTDEVDAAIISELLRQGHGRPYRPDEEVYVRLYHLERYRWAGEQASTRLKNQIIGHVDRLYPGLVISDQALAQRYQPLCRSLWDSISARRLLTLYPDPQLLRAETAKTLYDRFRSAGLWMTQPYAAKVMAVVHALPAPEPTMAVQRSWCLQRDLDKLADQEQQQAEVGAEMAAYLDQTWGRWLRTTQVEPQRLACLVATVGEISHYDSAGQLFGRSGLYPGCSDSGVRQRRGHGGRQVKPGDRHLRRQLMRFTMSMLARHPSLRAYRERLRQRGKRKLTANIAVARKLTGIIYALASRGELFDPSRLA